MSAIVTPLRKRTKPVEHPHPIEYLAFVDSSGPGPRDLWAVAATGDYNLDCVLGKGLAEQALAYFRTEGAMPILPSIIREMVKKGRCGGVEIGFISEIAIALDRYYRQQRLGGVQP